MLKNLYRKQNLRHHGVGVCTTFFAMLALFSHPCSGAGVVARGTSSSSTTGTSRVSVSSQNVTSVTRASTTATTTADDTADEEIEEYIEEEVIETEPEITIENKSSLFSASLSESSTSGATSDNAALASAIAAQRAALDAAGAATGAATGSGTMAAAASFCDAGLRECMQLKCGTDYSKCASDSDTDWGSKMETCRRDVTCTGTEYTTFSTEIKADRDINARLAGYNAVINCGNNYNDCIATQCGVTYSKCLGKSAEDAAIAACKTIADNCYEMDTGLASRTSSVFGTLRVDAEVQIQKDELYLYELRDKMAERCSILGAMFDERTLDCVYSVEFYAANSNTPYASKKAYAGSTFDCDQNWFGIDITTFKENAYRLTREQSSATSALMGSGVGMAVGAVTSGAISRSIDTYKAENALEDAEKEYEENYGDKNASKEQTTDGSTQTPATTQSETPGGGTKQQRKQ